jgi:hypothetical protein
LKPATWIDDVVGCNYQRADAVTMGSWKPGKHEERVLSDIAEASHLPELAKAEREENSRTEVVQRECDERLEAVRRECRTELDEVPRTLRDRRRTIVDDATAQADCDVDQVLVAMDKELRTVRELADGMTEELVNAVMERILPDSPKCQRSLGGNS